MYADDTQGYKNTKPAKINETIQLINSDLERVTKFSEDNCLRINEDKSNYIIIGSKKQINDLVNVRLDNIIINKEPIERKIQTKNLGVEFDQYMKWEAQINKQVKNAWYKLRQLYRFQNFLSEKCKTRLVETYVLSQLNYCSIVTQNITKELQGKVQKVQNACLRFIFGVRKYDHITPYLIKAGSLNMVNRTKYHALVQMHKIVTKQAPEYLQQKITFRRDIHNRNTRNRNALHLPKLKKNVKAGSFFYKTAKDYNQIISDEISTADATVNSFKRKCKKHILKSQLGN
jgi:hypothetical protein